jgi:hypothetical protein
VVRYNGGGVRYFRRGSAGAVVGSDEGGGCTDHFRIGRGRREVACVHAHEAAVVVAAIPPEEEDDWAGAHMLARKGGAG